MVVYTDTTLQVYSQFHKWAYYEANEITSSKRGQQKLCAAIQHCKCYKTNWTSGQQAFVYAQASKLRRSAFQRPRGKIRLWKGNVCSLWIRHQWCPWSLFHCTRFIIWRSRRRQKTNGFSFNILSQMDGSLFSAFKTLLRMHLNTGTDWWDRCACVGTVPGCSAEHWLICFTLSTLKAQTPLSSYPL